MSAREESDQEAWDRFAAAAMSTPRGEWEAMVLVVAESAEYADAMMVERAKRIEERRKNRAPPTRVPT